jgi:RNA polymerase sigma factor (sigma-70 family)
MFAERMREAEPMRAISDGEEPRAGQGQDGGPPGPPRPPDPGGPAATTRAAEADAASFEATYRASYARLVRIAHLIMGSNDVAEEVVQDAFVALYPRFATVGDPDGYLYRSVVNGCRGRFRRKQVAPRLAALREAARTVVQPEIDETWAALATLPPRRRAVVVLRFYADMPLAEIADVLGCRIGTVKSQLHRALAHLEDVIER